MWTALRPGLANEYSTLRRAGPGQPGQSRRRSTARTPGALVRRSLPRRGPGRCSRASPTPPNPAPIRRSPGRRSSRAPIAASRARCPTSCWGVQPWPAVGAGDDRRAPDVQQLLEVAVRAVDQVGVGARQHCRVTGAAQKPAQQHVAAWRAVRPLRRDPGGGQQRHPPLHAGDDETAAAQRVADVGAGVAQHHRGGRRVGNAAAERCQVGVERAHQLGRDVRRHGQDDLARGDLLAAAERQPVRAGALEPRHVRPRPVPRRAPARRPGAATISPMPPGSDRNRPSAGAGGPPRGEAPDDAAATRLGLDQPRKQGPHGQALDVAGVDAGQQRLGDVVDRLAAEAAGRRTTRSTRRPRRRRAGAERSAPGPCGAGRAARAAGSSPAAAAGWGRPAPRRPAARGAGPPRRTNALRGGRVATRRPPSPSSRAQLDRGRLLHQQGVRPPVDGEAADLLRADHAAEPGGALEQHVRHAARLQLVGRGQPADAAAHDRHVDVGVRHCGRERTGPAPGRARPGSRAGCRARG